MKLLDQARLPKAWFADNRYQLPLALPRALPASHQHGDFLVATHEGGESALSGSASTAARPNDPEQQHRLRHAFEFVAAPLLGDEQPRDLTLYQRRHHHGTRFGQRLSPRGDVRYIAENFAGRVEHRRASVDGDPCGERGLARAFVLAVQLGQRALNRERGAHSTLGIVLLRHRITEQRHQSVAQLLGDLAAHFHDRGRGGVDISGD
jgi:hypothetical protein